MPTSILTPPYIVAVATASLITSLTTSFPLSIRTMPTASPYWDDPDSWRTLLPPDDPLYRPPTHERPVTTPTTVKATATGSVACEGVPSKVSIAPAAGLSMTTTASVANGPRPSV